MRAAISLQDLLTLFGPAQKVRIRSNEKLDKLYEGSRMNIKDSSLLKRNAKLICADGAWLEVTVY